MAARTAIVLGAGISGLTSAQRLRAAGLRVRLLARQRPEDTTSAVSAAVWFPFAAAPRAQVDAWSIAAYHTFASQIEAGRPHVRWTPVHVRVRTPQPLPAWCDQVRGFHERPDGSGFGFDAPVADMPAYLLVLLAELEAGGTALEHAEVDELAALRGAADVLVHCTGLGARALVGDGEMFPIHGQVVRVARAGVDAAFIDDDHPDGMVYVVPRADDVVLGGITDYGVEGRAPDPAVAAAIRRRCEDAVPQLRGAEVKSHAAAARPGRSAVRVEREVLPGGQVVVHNYGHGGAGMTMSWGCADAVTALALS